MSLLNRQIISFIFKIKFWWKSLLRFFHNDETVFVRMLMLDKESIMKNIIRNKLRITL